MKNDTVLLVEDNEQIMKANQRMLELNGYTVMTAASIDEASRAMAHDLPDIIVLDIMLPDGSGLSMCQSLRSKGIGVPILFLTVMRENDDVVRGLQTGGDDYLVKPYDYDVLMARIEALLRRSRRSQGTDTYLKVGPYTLDNTAQRVYKNGRDMLLTPREYSLFRLLLDNTGVYFHPEVLYRKVWAINPTGDLRTIYAHISRLRSKLELDDSQILTIEQKRGKGYRLLRKIS